MDEKKRAELLDDKVKALEAPQRLVVENERRIEWTILNSLIHMTIQSM